MMAATSVHLFCRNMAGPSHDGWLTNARRKHSLLSERAGMSRPLHRCRLEYDKRILIDASFLDGLVPPHDSRFLR